jgi:AcrR family transcriptional regulator
MVKNRPAGLATDAVIVSAASRLFQSRGFAGTSLQDVARASGIPKGNFYYHYRSKDDIVRAVAGHRLAILDAELRRIEARAAAPLERLDRFTRSLAVHRDTPFALGCPHGSLGLELAKSRPDLLPAGRAGLDRLREWFAAQFRLAGRRDAASLAMHLLARVQGLLMVAAAYGDGGFARRELRELRRWIAAQA